jgi:hypothetical protein
LAVLVENNTEKRKLFSEIQKTEQKYNEIKDYKMSSTKHIQNVIKMLREYVDFGDVEIKTMGEVMTPISLVEEMLDTLPDNVWTNPNLKWLDPCNGAGIFISIIVQRLLKGLVNFEPDEDLRYKHIMENMIYVGELQPKNMFLYLYAFDPKDELDLNIYCGSYLTNEFDLHMKDVYGVEKFDIIVMNPPYNAEQKEKGDKPKPLWTKFVLKTLNNLIENGYLVAVHPSGWRNIDGHFKNIQIALKNKQILYLEVHSEKDGQKTFGATTAYDFYCLRNIENQGNFNTKIKCLDGTIERADLSKMEFIPNGMYNAIQNLLAKNGEETVELISNCSYHTQKTEQMFKEQNEDFKYPCIDNVDLKNTLSCVWYSNVNNKGHFGKLKVIFGQRRSGVFVDLNGEYGLTQHAYGIVDNVQNLERIKQAMLTPEFIKIMSCVDFANMLYNNKIIKLFRKNFWIDFLG